MTARSNNIEHSDKTSILSICWFGRSKQSATVIWKGKENYRGIYLREQEKSKFKTKKFPEEKITSILADRLLSDSCDLCELLSGKNKIDVDHDYMLYIR